MADTQRRFAVMGENLFRIVNKMTTNKRLCRLLKYQDKNPFRKELEDPNGIDMLGSHFIIVPKIPEPDGIERSYIVIVFDKFIMNAENPDFKLSTIRFDIICPFEEWIIDADNLRPYLIMQELDTMFNQAKLSGIGNLQFVRCEPLVLSPQLGGYTMYYQINEFN